MTSHIAAPSALHRQEDINNDGSIMQTVNTWYDEIVLRGDGVGDELADSETPHEAMYRLIDETLASISDRNLLSAQVISDLLLDLRLHLDDAESSWKTLFGMWWEKTQQNPSPSPMVWRALGKRLVALELPDRDVLARYAGNGLWELGEAMLSDMATLIRTEGLFTKSDLRGLAALAATKV